jgi:hypothetical protein
MARDPSTRSTQRRSTMGCSAVTSRLSRERILV